MFFSFERTLLAGCILAPLWCAAPAYAQYTTSADGAFYTSFQVPGSTATNPTSINSLLSVTGNYVDKDGYMHGFVRSPFGPITSFELPGSIRLYIGWLPFSMNAAGEITGTYRLDPGIDNRGFVRSPQGAITSFIDAVGSDTRVAGINAAGSVTGSFFDGTATRGFVRTRQGTITPFSVAGSRVTTGVYIRDDGTILGSYSEEAQNASHGFIRTPLGAITFFDPPGSVMNTAGTIAGYYFDQSIPHGFVRSAQGTVTSFDPPGSRWTIVVSMNAAGTIAGRYVDQQNVTHGFVRNPQGLIKSFDFPGATSTDVASLNDSGIITGSYYIAGSGTFGYLRVSLNDDQFQPGKYVVTDNRGLYLDGGFYLYGDPTVRLWVYVQSHPNQQWKFTQVFNGFTVQNQGTNQFASDIGGQLVEGRLADVWTVTPASGGYKFRNNRTGLYLTDPGVQEGAITLTRTGSAFQISAPQ